MLKQCILLKTITNFKHEYEILPLYNVPGFFDFSDFATLSVERY